MVAQFTGMTDNSHVFTMEMIHTTYITDQITDHQHFTQ